MLISGPISAWKLELTANSAIDVLDTQKKWYTGRVLEVRGDELLVTLNGKLAFFFFFTRVTVLTF
jgi:hypothetical protein